MFFVLSSVLLPLWVGWLERVVDIQQHDVDIYDAVSSAVHSSQTCRLAFSPNYTGTNAAKHKMERNGLLVLVFFFFLN